MATHARRRNHAVWIGPLVATIGALSYFTTFARFPVLRDFPWFNLPLVVLGVVVSALGVWRAFGAPTVFRGKFLGTAGFVLSLTMASLFAFYVFSLSYWIPAPTPVSMDLVTAPDFRLVSEDGTTPVSLGDFRGRKVVLVFYRGFW